MPSIPRPSTPRTELYNAIQRSNQRTLLRNIEEKFTTITAEQLTAAHNKYPDLKQRIDTLVDTYNPDTVSQHSFYDTYGTSLALRYEPEEKIPTTFTADRGREISENPSSHTKIRESAKEALKVMMNRDSTFKEFQNEYLEVFTIHGRTGSESVLNNQEGIRAKKSIPAFTLVDVWRGMVFNKNGSREQENLKMLHLFTGKEPNKFFASIGDYNIDIKSISMKANSGQNKPETTNLNALVLPHKTSTNNSIFVAAMVTNRDVEAGEELRYDYNFEG